MTLRLISFRLPAILLLSLATALCQAKTIALSFDDGFNPTQQPRAAQWNTQLLEALQAHDVQAALFPALFRLGNADSGLALVAEWSRAGHLVGNHTASHRSLADPQVSLTDFIADVQQADTALRHLPTFSAMLRFPYLKEGDTREKRDGMRRWMASHHYRSAPVSIDASDWYYNIIYAAHLDAGDRDLAARVMQAYIRHLLDRADYYDTLARQVLGRSPDHVILLHTNQLNAAAMPDVLAALQAHGWKIIPTAQAFQDPLYASAPDTLPAGESIIWAHARVLDMPGLRYPAEESVYEEPLLRNAGLLPATPAASSPHADPTPRVAPTPPPPEIRP